MLIGNSNDAVPYDQIARQADLEQSAANYLAFMYGDDIAHAIPIAQREIHVGVLYGYTEAQTQELILGMYGLKPL